jgi:hypothetical protein
LLSLALEIGGLVLLSVVFGVGRMWVEVEDDTNGTKGCGAECVHDVGWAIER